VVRDRKRRTALAGMAIFMVLFALPAAAGAEIFTDYGRAAQDQYGSPDPAPAQPAPATTSSGKGGREQSRKRKKAKGACRTAVQRRTKRCGAAARRRKAAVRRRRAALRRNGRVLGAVVQGGSRHQRGAALPLQRSRGGSLPFTGFDLTLLSLLGVGILAVGCTGRLVLRSRLS
jgi:hypothetical protein